MGFIALLVIITSKNEIIMGIVKNPMNIHFEGTVGGVIGYISRGRHCYRSMPSHYNDAKSEEQLRNRSKMKELMRFLCPLKEVIREG